MLTDLLKNVNYLNDSRVGKRDAKSFSSQHVLNMYWIVAFKIHVFDVSLFEETPNRVYSFHLNNLGNEVGNEFWICYVIKKCYLNLSIHISRD